MAIVKEILQPKEPIVRTGHGKASDIFIRSLVLNEHFTRNTLLWIYLIYFHLKDSSFLWKKRKGLFSSNFKQQRRNIEENIDLKRTLFQLFQFIIENETNNIQFSMAFEVLSLQSDVWLVIRWDNANNCPDLASVKHKLKKISSYESQQNATKQNPPTHNFTSCTLHYDMFCCSYSTRAL